MTEVNYNTLNKMGTPESTEVYRNQETDMQTNKRINEKALPSHGKPTNNKCGRNDDRKSPFGTHQNDNSEQKHSKC